MPNLSLSTKAVCKGFGVAISQIILHPLRSEVAKLVYVVMFAEAGPATYEGDISIEAIVPRCV